MKPSFLLFVLIISSTSFGIQSCSTSSAQNDTAPPEKEEQSYKSAMHTAAVAYLASLDAKQKAKSMLQFTDSIRVKWSFFPEVRKGLPLREMTEAQQQLALALVQTGLSEAGYTKMQEIRSLEDILTVLEKRKPGNDYRNTKLYYVAIFGEPSNTKPWGWRFEGHHVSLNYSSIEDKVAVVPSFFGTNPAEVPSGDSKGKRVLAEEEDLARALVKSLDKAQLGTALISKKTFGEIVTVSLPKVQLDKMEGLPAAKMTAEQQKALLQIVDLYLGRLTDAAAAALRKRTQESGFDKLHFAWAGGLDRHQQHYYRIHGPKLLIEFDNSQNNGNHAHSIIRDITNDFGEDFLRTHYEQHHK